MSCTLKKCLRPAAFVLAPCAICLSLAPASAQSVDIPLQLEQGNGAVILTINVGINGAAPRPYLFDTGSNVFNAYYSAAAFGGLPKNMASSGLPTGIGYSYGDGSASNEFDSNVIKVPSLTFYATPTSTSGVTLNAVTPGGSASSFLVNAVYARDGTLINANSPALQATPTFSGYYGIFGADGLASILTGGNASVTPAVVNNSSVVVGGILGQAVVPGTTAGYVVAANGQALSSLQTAEGQVPGSSVNGVQATQCAIASCSPSVMLGLTPALLAQFAPANTLAATPSSGPAFPNSGAQSLREFPIDLAVTLNVPGQAPITLTQKTLLDTGTGNNQLFNSALSDGHVAQGATLTISTGLAGSSSTTYVVSPSGSNGYTYASPPYDVKTVYTSGAGETYLGIGFFLQNSVLYDLAGEAIGYTPNYVTDANIVTTPSSPLTIGASSVPLGLAGVISGAGGVVITAGGSATLSGTNTYTGATTIDGGTLALVGPGSIAASSGVSVTGGGIFDISGVTGTGSAIIQSLSGDATSLVSLGANTLVLSNASGSYAGVLYGSGGLTVAGGTQTLGGINTYTGPTTVDGGILVVNGVLAGTSSVAVNAGGALAGSGIIDPLAVTIYSGGTLAPGRPGVGGSTMTIIGNLALQSGATYLSFVGPGGASFANVTGTASLAGTVTAAFAGAPVTKSNVILASSGLNGTRFDSFTTVNLPQSLSATISYDSDNVFLNLTSNMAAVPGLTGSQRAIAGILDSNFNSGHLPAAFSAVYGLSGSNLANGLSTLSGESTTGGEQSSFQLMNSFLGVMFDPFVDGRAGPGADAGSSGSGGALGYASTGGGLSPAVADAYAAALKAPKLVVPQPGWSLWGSAYGGALNLSANGSATGLHDVSAGTYGFATGADYHPTSDTAFGFALAGGGTSWSVDSLGGGNSTAAQVGVYGRTLVGPAYVAGALAFTNYWVSTNRATFTGDALNGDFAAQGFGARAEAGYRFTLPAGFGPAMTLAPYAAVAPQFLHTPAFSEMDLRGSGFALSYQASDAVDTRTELGARLATSMPLVNGMSVNLWGRAAWAHDFVSNPALTASFESLPGSSFVVYGARPADNSALVSVGSELHITHALSLLMKFDGQFARNEQIATGNATLRYAW
jgi:outer membrane autotransporter protein